MSAQLRSTSQRTMPPTKIGAEADSGKYTPTANACAGTSDICNTTAIVTPTSTSAHGNWRSRRWSREGQG